MAIEINPATPKAYLAMAMAALTRGNRAAATASYREAHTKAGPRGRSLAAMGLADMAMYYGEFAAAEQLLTAGIADDAAVGNVAARQNKYHQRSPKSMRHGATPTA